MGFGDQSTGRGTFGGEFGSCHCNQWGLYRICVRQCRNVALFPHYIGQTCLTCVFGTYLLAVQDTDKNCSAGNFNTAEL